MLAAGAVVGGQCDAVFEVADADGTSRLPVELAHGIRFDVDCDPARSHPIRRHPISPDPRYPCFTGNYFIPNDNPFVSSSGDALEEYWAIGLRNPDVMARDPMTGEIWVSDVGQQLREEINLLTKGGNYEWSYREGIIAGPKPRPADVFGREIAPVYDYRHRDGNNSVVGGHVYRGKRHVDQLTGKYLFGRSRAA